MCAHSCSDEEDGIEFTLDDTFMRADKVVRARDETIGVEVHVCKESEQEQVSEFHSLMSHQPVNQECLLKAQQNNVTLTECFKCGV